MLKPPPKLFEKESPLYEVWFVVSNPVWSALSAKASKMKLLGDYVVLLTEEEFWNILTYVG